MDTSSAPVPQAPDPMNQFEQAALLLLEQAIATFSQIGLTKLVGLLSKAHTKLQQPSGGAQ